VPHLKAQPDVSAIAGALRYADWIAPYASGAIAYASCPSTTPCTSCYVRHTASRNALCTARRDAALRPQTYKLQFDVRPLDRFFYYTTCNWVMWNLLFQGLLAEASVMLYDGSPFMRDGAILFDYCDASASPSSALRPSSSTRSPSAA